MSSLDMKLKLKRKASYKEKDDSKASQFKRKLWKLSIRSRNKQLQQQRSQKPLRRGESPDPSPDSPTHIKTSVKLNVSGNLRGMHNHLNPPDSEHMRKIRAMRRFYNKQMPVLACNSCMFASQCPQYKAGYECAFLPFLNAHKVESEKDLLEYMKELLGSNMRRLHLATLQETLSGGKISFETSEALNLAFMQLKGLHEIMSQQGGSVSIETNDGSVIQKIFGGLDNLLGATRDAQATPIDVSPIKAIEDKKVDNSSAILDNDNRVNEELVREHSRSEIESAVGRKIESRNEIPQPVVLSKD